MLKLRKSKFNTQHTFGGAPRAIQLFYKYDVHSFIPFSSILLRFRVFAFKQQVLHFAVAKRGRPVSGQTGNSHYTD